MSTRPEAKEESLPFPIKNTRREHFEETAYPLSARMQEGQIHIHVSFPLSPKPQESYFNAFSDSLEREGRRTLQKKTFFPP